MKNKSTNICSLLNEREILSCIEKLRYRYSKQIEVLGKNTDTVPDTQLKVCRHRKCYQCYLVDTGSGKTKYVPGSDARCRKIAQAEYNSKQMKLLQKRLSILDRFSSEIEKNPLETAYKKTSDGRKTLIKPLETDDETFINNWTGETYEGKAFISDETVFMTARGERVRSKSEILIADELGRMNIPYKYEHPLTIGGVVFHPDFTILNAKTRREVIWEHFGLLDDPGYRDDFLRKIKAYESEGFILGVNFFFTAETSRVPLSRNEIIATIRKICG